ncbi:Cache 3/Cache 2 fusion domain-containing protein [Chondrinema litorale]|uniref:Cache 3/Cache 2 fusion domain-containing protein n=1 Tax=Chondrinema litorale TaxID=2994555 RepID=UPI002542AF76|nr:Cache 3/Cache 2 fusion domain-containing protein [Chondrinema litorale]UZR94473.1 Cache 3/Cache 2 fusion domain-containing protein [Chondrinema litorale]
MRKILQNFGFNLKTQFILFTSLTFTLVFTLLASGIYLYQKKLLIESNEARMYGHVQDLINTINIYYEERKETILKTGDGFEKLLSGSKQIVETDSTISMPAISFRDGTQKTVEVNQWLYLGEQLQYGDHYLVDAIGDISGGYVSLFQKAEDEHLVIQTNMYLGSENRSENVLVSEDVLDEAFSGEEVLKRIFIIDKWTQSLYKPLKINGETKGVLFVGLDENIDERAAPIFNEISYFQTGYPYCFDSKGKFLIHPTLKGDSINNYIDVASLSRDKHNKIRYEYDENGQSGVNWIYYQYYAPYDIFVAATVNEEDFLGKPLFEIRMIIFFGLLTSLVIGITGIYFMVDTITKPINTLNSQLQELAQGKKVKYKPIKRKDEIGHIAKAVGKVINSVNDASKFAEEIGNENYDAEYKAISDEDVLGNALLNMKDNLQKSKTEREQRAWINTGIASFNNILRSNSNEIEELSEQILIQIIKYLNANQGALYVVQEKDQLEKLVLSAYYAWGKKKHLKQEILPGDGQIGQIWLEKEYIYMENIPDNYVHISSGLGDANPRMILIVPLILNDVVYGIMEIASFEKLEEFKVQFVLRIAESIASTLSMVQTNEKTHKLLKKTQQMTEELRSQEEEMRQNVEELQATHEEMNRREKLLRDEIEDLKTENEQLKSPVE